MKENRWDRIWKSSQKTDSIWHKYMYMPRYEFITSRGLENKLVLEAGCGSGVYGGILMNHSRVVFLDYSLEALKLTRKNTGSTFLVRADIMHMPFKQGSFDAVISLGVMEHFDHKTFLNALYNVMDEDGTIIIGVPNKKSFYHVLYCLLYPLGLWKYGKEDMLSISDFKKIAIVRAYRIMYAFDIIPFIRNYIPFIVLDKIEKALEKYGRFIMCELNYESSYT